MGEEVLQGLLNTMLYTQLLIIRTPSSYSLLISPSSFTSFFHFPTMHESWKTILALSSFALTSTAKGISFDARLMVQQAGLPSVLSNGSGPPPQLDLPNTRPARSIDPSQIVPTQDASDNSRCCPIGTVNNLSGCVFPHSSVCPEGTRLAGNTCISEKPPKYPDGLIYNGRNCIGTAPSSPPGS